MNNSATPTLLINSCFTDIEQCAMAVGWDIGFRQIEPGPLSARIVGFGHAEIRVMRVEFDRRFHQIGRPPQGFTTFGLPDKRSGVLRWSGIETPPGVLINFNYEKMLDCVNPQQFGGYVFMFENEVLRNSFRGLGFDDKLSDDALNNRFWNPVGGELEHLRQDLHALENAALNDDDEGLRKLRTLFNSDLVSQVIRILSNDAISPQSIAPKFRSASMERAMEILSDDTKLPPRVGELCSLIGTSRATLERSFKDEFGITPRSYIKSKQLSGVHSEFFKLGPEAVISNVANRWGFWHMGGFAADYRKQFGELPSETLKRLQVK